MTKKRAPIVKSRNLAQALVRVEMKPATESEEKAVIRHYKKAIKKQEEANKKMRKELEEGDEEKSRILQNLAALDRFWRENAELLNKQETAAPEKKLEKA